MTWMSSRSLLILILVVAPGGVLVVAGAVLEAAVQDPDQAVAELAQHGLVPGAPGTELVAVTGTRSRRVSGAARRKHPNTDDPARRWLRTTWPAPSSNTGSRSTPRSISHMHPDHDKDDHQTRHAARLAGAAPRRLDVSHYLVTRRRLATRLPDHVQHPRGRRRIPGARACSVAPGRLDDGKRHQHHHSRPSHHLEQEDVL